MKRLNLFIIRSFIGPFLITFAISMFFLIMQFLWKYVDDLMGKGLEISIILELLFYVSATIIPLALPIAVLFSSIMTFGNLAEKSELTAMKSSGISLFRAMRPMLIFMIFLSLGAFYFTNYTLPVANYKWRALIFDIQQKKPTFAMKEGVFYNDIDDYSIKVEEKNDNTGELKDVLIYETADFKQSKIIRAKQGEMLKTQNERFLLLKLTDGIMYQRIPMGAMNNSMQGYQKWRFDETIIKFDLSSFALQESEEEMFKNDYEMMNVIQLQIALDSLTKIKDTLEYEFIESFKNNMVIYNETLINPPPTNDSINLIGNEPEKVTEIIYLDSLNRSELQAAMISAQTEIRTMKDMVSGQSVLRNARVDNMRNYKAFWHKKFTLSFAIIILFFIGAPLGAIVRKGGLGAPLVLATLFFLLYYVLTIMGENMVESRVLEPYKGMWMSSILLTPLGIFLTYKAANDSAIFDRDAYKKFFARIFKPKSNR